MKKQDHTIQLLNFAPDSYLERTSRPIYALFFLLPFIIFYEIGTIFISTSLLRENWQGRVVAFAWVQRFLEYIGFSGKLALIATPLTVVVILLALQLASRKRWTFFFGDIAPMVVECILLAVPLIVLGLFLNSPARPRSDYGAAVKNATQMQFVTTSNPAYVVPASRDLERGNLAAHRGTRLLANIVTGIGAGIYEELAFRLFLICVLMLLFQDLLRFNHSNSIVLSVLVSAALFSAYHHVDFFTGQLYQSDPFNWMEFGFRTIAGVYFAVLFAVRGFGITAGTHAFYDIIATGINFLFFDGGN